MIHLTTLIPEYQTSHIYQVLQNYTHSPTDFTSNKKDQNTTHNQPFHEMFRSLQRNF